MIEIEKMTSGLAFHCHHDKFYDYVHNFDERVQYIKDHKPPKERELRLRLFQLIPSERLPGKDTTLWADYIKAWADYIKAEADHDKAWADYDKAYNKELLALHQELCPSCPWDGHTIFTKEAGIKK